VGVEEEQGEREKEITHDCFQVSDVTLESPSSLKTSSQSDFG
jgi:hypothetical protein